MHRTERFDYVKYDDATAAKQEGFKMEVMDLAHSIEQLAPGRAQSLALTKLEECYMWIGKALRDEQIKKNSETK